MRWMALVWTLALTGCATGMDSRATLDDAISDVVTLTRSDLRRAYEIAEQDRDQAGMACSLALLNKLEATASRPRLEPAGAFSAYMRVRQVRRTLDAGRDEDLHNACAPLMVDTARTLGKLGRKAFSPF